MSDTGEEGTAEMFITQNSSALNIIMIASAALVGLALCCAVRKFCCESARSANARAARSTVTSSGATAGGGDKDEHVTVEMFARRNPPRVAPPQEGKQTDAMARKTLSMIQHGRPLAGGGQEETDPTSSKAMYTRRSATHENALLFGLEDPNSTTSFKEKGVIGHRHKEQFLMHPVQTYIATRPLHEPQLDTHLAVYYEVTIDHLDTMMPECGVAIGWATSPFPFNCLPGLADFSMALHTHQGLIFASGFARPYKYLQSVVRRGDTIGAGYERVLRPKPCVEFFFTHNGKRLRAVPHLRLPYDDMSVSGRGLAADNTSGIEKMKYNTSWQRTPEAVALMQPDEPSPKKKKHSHRSIVPWETKTNHMSQHGTTPDYLPCLVRGAGHPAVGCFGTAKVRLNFNGPFMYRPEPGTVLSTSYKARAKGRTAGAGAGAGAGGPAPTASAHDLMSALQEADEEGWAGMEKPHDPTAAELMASLRYME